MEESSTMQDHQIDRTYNVTHNAPRKLYVGNLDVRVTEEMLMMVFGQLGTVLHCKLIRENNGLDNYAFIEMETNEQATNVLIAMNRRILFDKELKVNWATNVFGQSKVDTSSHFHIFVGDLSAEIKEEQLQDAFSPYGSISEVKVMRFGDTQKSKGYGFVSFVNKSDAANAIRSMNGQWLGTRKVRTNWASRGSCNSSSQQTNMTAIDSSRSNIDASSNLVMDENEASTSTANQRNEFIAVWDQTNDSNTSVYVGNLNAIFHYLTTANQNNSRVSYFYSTKKK